MSELWPGDASPRPTTPKNKINYENNNGQQIVFKQQQFTALKKRLKSWRVVSVQFAHNAKRPDVSLSGLSMQGTRQGRRTRRLLQCHVSPTQSKEKVTGMVDTAWRLERNYGLIAELLILDELNHDLPQSGPLLDAGPFASNGAADQGLPVGGSNPPSVSHS